MGTNRDEFYTKVGLTPSNMSEAVTSDAADADLSEVQRVGIQARPDDASHVSATPPPDQHSDGPTAELRDEPSRVREIPEPRLRAEEGDSSGQVGPDDAPIEATSTQPTSGDEGLGHSLERGDDPADTAASEPPRQRNRRWFPLEFAFLDRVFGPDPDD